MASLCQELGLQGFCSPSYPNRWEYSWDFLQELLAGVSPVVADSEYLPGPLQVLYTLDVFAEIEPQLEWLRTMGKMIALISNDCLTLIDSSVLPRFLKLDVLIRLGNELQKVYEVGTEWIAERIESGIPLAEGLPKDWLKTCKIAPDDAGYLVEPNRWLEDAKLYLKQFRDLAASLARFCSAATHALSRDSSFSPPVPSEADDDLAIKVLEALGDFSIIQSLATMSQNSKEAVDTQQKRQVFALVSALRYLDTRSQARRKSILGNMQQLMQDPSLVLAPSECLVPEHALMIDQPTLDELVRSQRWLRAIDSNTNDSTRTGSIEGGT